MANASGCEFDVFISYAHVDNDPFYPAERGWVSVLIDNLGRYLAKRLGRREAFSNWYDQQKLQGNHGIGDFIPEQVKRSSLFLAILSPGYVASEFCLKELQAFMEANRNDLNERLFVIEHMALEDLQQTPDPFRDVRKYRFWALDANEKPRTYAMPVPLPDEREYFQKIDDLARDIASKLTSIGPSTKRSGPAVLLAEVTDDLEARRDEVARYLDQAGIEVLPSGSYRLEREDFERSLTTDLANSAVFVQLLGGFPGKRPPDVPDGFGWLQYEMAKKANVPILQWRSPELDVAKVALPLQQRLLDLNTVRAVPFEDFKRTVVTSFKDLIERKNAPPQPEKTASDPSMVFINADPVDMESAEAIKNSLGDSFGWAMPLSLYDSEAKPDELQQDMESNLINSEGLFIVYGAARPGWVTSQLQLYRKLAHKRKQGPRLLAVVEAPPKPKAPISIGLPGLMTIGLDRVPEVLKSVLKS